jgi:predicted alpha/beta hydrolase family esterase
MKNVIILPGFSSKNQELLDTYVPYFKDKGYKVNAIKWPHWKSGNKSDFVKEEQVERIVCLLDNIDRPITFFAKSVGTIILSEVLKVIDKIKIQKIVLAGLPLGDGSSNLIDVYKSLNDLNPSKIIIIQAKNDPYSPFKAVKKFIREDIGNNDIKVLEIDRNDHIYPIESVEEYFNV